MGKTNILLVGGSGFLGRYLAKEYLRLDNNVTILARNSFSESIESKGIHYHLLDLEGAIPWDEITRDIDIAYFLYSPNIPRTSPSELSAEIAILTDLAQKFLDACVRNKVQTICFPSSGGAVYGKSSDNVLSEKSLTNPISNYGISKLLFEKMIIMYSHLHGLDYLIFRLSNVYGPHQNLNKPQGVISHWLNHLIKGGTIEIWGDGKVKRDYIFINDAVGAMVSATKSKIRNEIFNVGYGESFSLLDILEVLRENLGLEVNCIFKDFHKTDVQDATLDVSLFKTTFSWSPRVNLEEGVRLTYNFLIGNNGK